MRGKRCAEELKIEAIRQVTDSGYPVTEVVQRLGGGGTQSLSELRHIGRGLQPVG